MVAGTMVRSRTEAQSPQQARQAARQGDQPQVAPRPFVAGSRPTKESDYDDTLVFTTGEQRFDSYEVGPQGFLGHLWMLMTCVTAGNAAAVAFADDAPFSAAARIEFRDVGSQPQVGVVDGYQLYVINKYGGYLFQGDPKAGSVYSVTAGAGATGGSFTFILFVPIMAVRRDAFGELENTSASATFTMDVSLAPTVNVYDTAPTNAGTARLRYLLEGHQDPDETDINGFPVGQAPPASQTTQYWESSPIDVALGAFSRTLRNFNGLLRTMIFIPRGAADTLRSTGETAFDGAPFSLQYEANLLHNQVQFEFWRHWITSHYGYAGTLPAAGTEAAATTAGARDHGVYPIPDWMLNFGHQVGAELRFTYLPVSDATKLTIKGSNDAAIRLDILYNYLRYMGDPKELTGGR